MSDIQELFKIDAEARRLANEAPHQQRFLEMLEAARYIRLDDGVDPLGQTAVAQYDDDGVPTDLRLYSIVPADRFGEAPEKAFCGVALAAGLGYRGFICVFYFDARGALVGHSVWE